MFLLVLLLVDLFNKSFNALNFKNICFGYFESLKLRKDYTFTLSENDCLNLWCCYDVSESQCYHPDSTYQCLQEGGTCVSTSEQDCNRGIITQGRLENIGFCRLLLKTLSYCSCIYACWSPNGTTSCFSGSNQCALACRSDFSRNTREIAYKFQSISLTQSEVILI